MSEHTWMPTVRGTPKFMASNYSRKKLFLSCAHSATQRRFTPGEASTEFPPINCGTFLLGEHCNWATTKR